MTQTHNGGGAHSPVKPEKLVAAAAASLEAGLVVPALFNRKGIEDFVGAKDDKVNIKVEGVLPYRKMGWRFNRNTPANRVKFDTYKERTIQVGFGDDIYSGVALTDEQSTMKDFDGWAKLLMKQTEAIGKGLEYEACDYVENAPYQLHVQLDEANLRGSIIKLRQVFNALQVPGVRTVLCNTELEAALLDDDKLQLASNVGDSQAETAVTEATLLRRYGFNFVTAQELEGDSVAMTQDAFVFLTAAPSVPASAGFGAAASVNGVALRWVRGYTLEALEERSVVNAYKGFDHVTDVLRYRDKAKTDGEEYTVSQFEHFVRAVKVSVGTGFAFDIEANPKLSAGDQTAQTAEFKKITRIESILAPTVETDIDGDTK